MAHSKRIAKLSLKMFIVLVIFIFQEVFAQLNETSDSVSVSFFEIYNEKVFDLLGDNKVRILIRMKINSMLTILVLCFFQERKR